MEPENKYLNQNKHVKMVETARGAGATTEAPLVLMRPQGRRPGKRSDPEFKAFTILLRTKTHRMARRKLEDTEAGYDISTLIEKLLTEWTAQA